MIETKTQIGIIGAGPAGLMLAHLLHSKGIESVVLETRSREYVQNRVRAGVLEQGTVDLLRQLKVDARMQKEGLLHRGIELGFNHQRHRIDMEELTGRAVTVYGQHEVVKDLITAMETSGIPLLFEVSGVSLEGLDSDTPSLRFEHEGDSHELQCIFIAGCDGFHGVSRPSIPSGVLCTFDRLYPFSWLGILAEAPPSLDELVYMNSERGFALFSMRSPSVTRLYLQCDPAEEISEWSDDRIWDELLQRFSCRDGWVPNVGPVLQKSVTPMRSFVTEPMQFGRLFLAGDAAHIVPPTGAKGMNLAISDVKVLAEGLGAFFLHNDSGPLRNYSSTCLRRIWKAQRFSWWMTSLLHRDPHGNQFDHRRQIAELDYVTTSIAAAKSLAENYVGLPIESAFAL
jgi:p-hydroxybenzoate 3-monooxygenase